MKKVLFVCLGNICRSPTADGVFKQLVSTQRLHNKIYVDSAGTAAYHIGNPPDSRSIAAAKQRGYDLSSLRARQVISADFDEFDYVLAMDNENLSNLKSICPEGAKAYVGLFLDFTGLPVDEVPDPYYGGEGGFEYVLDLIESASAGLLQHIQKEL
ncbi:low molecular weight protein-tyrosine-phosphatase [Neptuniibacter sp. 1_MG-2023]|uniref:low molecular weight protein-tyrosine-phosphatase n=1 Tax=Neptuniibacter sp. 1_MG-2023 TaxID=3062662 RepID=UPI0026E4792D|nr:low molecular weight protein-tyrosine-phosphatase [Neptuniibacter sp. 1_MG-2023]MDO6595071.1 low molecular weight protein-tyrosine-phosphatase [Neptuniibacter sp. 1_MG-2023]